MAVVGSMLNSNTKIKRILGGFLTFCISGLGIWIILVIISLKFISMEKAYEIKSLISVNRSDAIITLKNNERIEVYLIKTFSSGLLVSNKDGVGLIKSEEIISIFLNKMLSLLEESYSFLLTIKTLFVICKYYVIPNNL